MAPNFKIFQHRNGGNLHLKLSGDFDDDSAQQMLDVLTKRYDGVFRVIIHTSSLECITSLEKTAFQNYIEMIHRHANDVIFTGEYANLFGQNPKH